MDVSSISYSSCRSSVVITGVSSGIGLACVEKLINENFFVFGSVRRNEDANRLKRLFGENFEPLFFDVTDDEAIDNAAAIVAARMQGRALAGLINNAGVCFPGPLLHLPIENFRKQIAINLTGNLKIIQAFAPLLGASNKQLAGPRGRIINISSLSGRFALPFLGAYCASKFGLEALSDALRRELMIYGVGVIVIQPGVIATRIYDDLETYGITEIEKTIYAKSAMIIRNWAISRVKNALPASNVANAVQKALTAHQPPIRIVVEKISLRSLLIALLLPDRVIDLLIASWLGFKELRFRRTKKKQI